MRLLIPARRVARESRQYTRNNEARFWVGRIASDFISCSRQTSLLAVCGWFICVLSRYSRANWEALTSYDQFIYEQTIAGRLRGPPTGGAIPGDAHPAGSQGSLHAAGGGVALGPVHRQACQPRHAAALGDRRQSGGHAAGAGGENPGHHPAVRTVAAEGQGDPPPFGADHGAPRRRGAAGSLPNWRLCPAWATRPRRWS